MKKGLIPARISKKSPLFSKENRERARQERMNEMFVMKKVGRKISELRKAKNMTQLELADKMNVSFQAVSNWERGNSMPDISKLPELAEIFGTSIDVILGAKSELIESAAEGKLEEYVSENKVSVEELKEAAPILKPDQVEKVVGSVEGISERFESMKKKTSEAMTMAKEQLKHAGEQLNEDFAKATSEAMDVAKEQVKAAQEQIAAASEDMKNSQFYESKNGETVVVVNGKRVYPDMDENGSCNFTIDSDGSISDNDTDDDDNDDISWLLPYLSDDDVGEFADKMYEAEGIAAVIKIADSVDEDLLAEIAMKEVRKNGIKGIIPIAEYLDEDKLGEIAMEEVKKNGIKNIVPIAEYIDEDKLGEIALYEVEQNGIKGIIPIAEYIDEDNLGRIAGKEVVKNGIKNIIPIAEYIEEGMLGEAALYEAAQNGIEGILPIAEYIDEDNLGRIAAVEVSKNGIKGIIPIAEYIDEDVLGEIAMEEAKKNGLKAIKPIIEYLDEDTIGDIVRVCRKK